MHCLPKKHFIVLCILQIAQSICGQQTTLEPFKDEHIYITTVSNELLREDEVQMDTNIFENKEALNEDNPFNLAEEEMEMDANLFTLTTTLPVVAEPSEELASTSNCLDDCYFESKEKRCLCNCDTGDFINDCHQSSEVKEVELTTIATYSQSSEEQQTEENLVEEQSSAEPCQIVGEVKGSLDKCESYAMCLPAEEGLYWSEQECPVGTAFNSLLKRCARDLAECAADTPVCTRSGTFPDVAGNNTYIWCLPRRTQMGWHKYRVRCAAYEIFLPTLGTCFVDVQKLNAGAVFMHEARDVDIIKAELAEMKVLEKQHLKEEKLKLKLKKKQEKLMMKKAIKEAQERAKLEGADSSELKGFVCMQEGAFPSPLGNQFYNNCVLKKGKFKALTMMCVAESKFNEESGICS